MDAASAAQRLFTLRLVLAAVPAAGYFLYLAFLHMRGRPKVLSAGRDLSLLTLSLVPAVSVMLDWTTITDRWIALSLGAALLIVLLILVLPGELRGWIVYNADRDEVTAAIAESLDELGAPYRQRGHRFELPEHGVQIVVGGVARLHNVSVHHEGLDGADGPLPDMFETVFRLRCGKLPAASSAAAMMFVVLSLAVIAWPAIRVWQDYAGLVKLFSKE